MNSVWEIVENENRGTQPSEPIYSDNDAPAYVKSNAIPWAGSLPLFSPISQRFLATLFFLSASLRLSFVWFVSLVYSQSLFVEENISLAHHCLTIKMSVLKSIVSCTKKKNTMKDVWKNSQIGFLLFLHSSRLHKISSFSIILGYYCHRSFYQPSNSTSMRPSLLPLECTCRAHLNSVMTHC